MPAQGRWSTFRFSPLRLRSISPNQFFITVTSKIMMKKLSLAICYIFFYVHVSAQSTFTGRVIDAVSGEPVAGATIQVDHATSVIADESGNFSIPLSKRSQLLSVSSVGYRPAEATAEKGKEAIIRLERYNLFLQP